MVNINRVRIQGFKPHEELDLPAKDINIITGKNNVGKTSVLEAIDLNFNPKSLRNFEGNADNLINVDSDEARISCEISGTSIQRDLTNFDQGGISRDIKFRKMSNQEKYDVLVDAVSSRIVDSFEFSMKREIPDSIRKKYTVAQNRAVQQTVSEIQSKDELNRYVESAIIIEQDDLKIPYVYLSSEYSDLTNIAVENTIKFLEEEVKNSEEDIKDNIIVDINKRMRTLIMGRYGRANFMEQPDTMTGVKFIKTLDITEKDVEAVDNYSVILSRIEDDLRKHNAIQDLNDFSLDNLVFEKGDDRYQLPYDSMGDGFKSIVGLLWELKTADSDSQILLLEETENHMHPGYIQKLVNFISVVSMEEDVQFFITTHNIDLIDEFIDPSNPQIKSYLQENMQLIQIQKYASQVMSHEEAQRQFEDLHLDLRGE